MGSCKSYDKCVGITIGVVVNNDHRENQGAWI